MNEMFVKYNKFGLFYYILFVVLSLSVLSIWDYKNIYTVTGDEPHYLVMANGIVKYKSLEQTLPYSD